MVEVFAPELSLRDKWSETEDIKQYLYNNWTALVLLRQEMP